MAKRSVGAKLWLIPDCYLPEKSTGGMESHESTCVLNLGAKTATINLTAFFEDRAPIKGLRATCPPQRTMHIRINTLKNPKGETIPTGKPFALRVRSNVKIVVQHTRLDTTQPALSLMTTMAFAAK
ncbi:MAG: sensory rhodopsin transducer [Terriglobia bacterium]